MTEYVPEVVARNTGFIGTVKTTNTVFNNILVLKKGRVQREMTLKPQTLLTRVDTDAI